MIFSEFEQALKRFSPEFDFPQELFALQPQVSGWHPRPGTPGPGCEGKYASNAFVIQRDGKIYMSHPWLRIDIIKADDRHLRPLLRGRMSSIYFIAMKELQRRLDEDRYEEDLQGVTGIYLGPNPIILTA